MSDLLIRKYQTADKDSVKKLYELASIHSEIGYRSGPWEQDFDDIEGTYFSGGEFIVGLSDNQIVAIGGYKKVSNTIGQIRRMRVHPNYRRKGYASQILEELEKVAKENGITELRLKTSTQQMMAQNLYEKHGFKKMKTKKEFYTEGGGNSFEVIWYRKELA
ncbi:MAG TPA: GNAT family N-acetyltransferase [Patescibacteria group bacterium]